MIASNKNIFGSGAPLPVDTPIQVVVSIDNDPEHLIYSGVMKAPGRLQVQFPDNVLWKGQGANILVQARGFKKQQGRVQVFTAPGEWEDIGGNLYLEAGSNDFQ